MLAAIKAANRHRHAPLAAAVPWCSDADDDGHAAWEETVAARDCDPALVVELRSDLEHLRDYCARNLSPLEREVLDQHSAGHGLTAIASAVGRQVKAVDNALQRTRRKLDVYRAAGRRGRLTARRTGTGKVLY